MTHRKLQAALLLAVLSVSACRSDVRNIAPYKSESGLSLEIDDGTGIFYSKTKSYIPSYCGTIYPRRKMDIGQESFEAIEGLVKAGDIWSAHVVSVAGCHVIDVGLPEPIYKFEEAGKSVTINVTQCKAIDAAHEPFIKAIRQIVRNVSDRQKLYVAGDCIYF